MDVHFFLMQKFQIIRKPFFFKLRSQENEKTIKQNKHGLSGFRTSDQHATQWIVETLHHTISINPKCVFDGCSTNVKVSSPVHPHKKRVLDGEMKDSYVALVFCCKVQVLPLEANSQLHIAEYLWYNQQLLLWALKKIVVFEMIKHSVCCCKVWEEIGKKY